MDKQFKGEFISYNITQFKKQLNNKCIYLDSYEIDDAIKLLNMIDKYDLDTLSYDDLWAIMDAYNKMFDETELNKVIESISTFR